jgi:hypothetical protein
MFHFEQIDWGRVATVAAAALGRRFSLQLRQPRELALLLVEAVLKINRFNTEITITIFYYLS